MKSSSLLTLASVFSFSFIFTSACFAESAGMSTSSGTDATHPGDGRSAYMPEVGISAGGATQNGTLYKTDGAYQIEAGLTPYAPFNFALQAQYNPSSLDVPFVHVNFNTTDIVLKETASLGMPGTFLGEFYVGSKTGIAIYSGDIQTKTNLALGGTAGFDIPLNSGHKASLGAEGTYLAVLGGNDNNQTPDQVSVLGTMKYWF